MRINVAVPEAHVSRPVLDAALEATTRVNEAMLAAGEVPHFDEVRHRIRWKPEPPGDEHFDHAKVVLGRGWGDCDDMAPFAAASMRHSGEDPGAKAIVKRSGPSRWHAVVQRSDGSIRDPSRETGMGQTNGVLGSALPMMMIPGAAAVVGGTFLVRPQLALRPIRSVHGIEAWQARADLPWHWVPGGSPGDVAMVSLHASPVSSQAVVGACEGLLRIGEANDVDSEALDRAACIMHAADGVPWEDLADEYGPEHATAAGTVIGSFFGDIAKKAGKAFGGTPLGTMASFIPGMPASSPVQQQGFGRFGAPSGGGGMPIMQMKEFLAQNPQFAPLAQQLLPMAGMAFGPLGAMGGSMLSQFVTPQQAAFQQADPRLQQSLQQGLNMPPPGMMMPQGGGMMPQGGGFNPLSMFGFG